VFTIGRPQLGQNAADSGMRAAQSGHERGKGLGKSIFSAPYQNAMEGGKRGGINLHIDGARSAVYCCQQFQRFGHNLSPLE